MRGANRNKQKFWYSLFDQASEGKDEYGNIVSQFPTYGDPIMTRGNISPGKGEVVYQMFGLDDMYDRVIGPLPINTPISEDSVLWIDNVPALDDNGHLALNDKGKPLTPYNYVVRKKTSGLPQFGGVMLGADKVTVT